jgi:hypothetical protein
MRTPH